MIGYICNEESDLEKLNFFFQKFSFKIFLIISFKNSFSINLAVPFWIFDMPIFLWQEFSCNMVSEK